jgi:uncharacterized protein (DUF433 family)
MKAEGETAMNNPRVIELGRGPTLEGTRFTVYDIVPLLQKGRNVGYIAAAYGLSHEQVETLIRYVEEHKEAVMAENAKIEDRIARGNPPEIQAKLDASRGTARRARRALLRRKKQKSQATQLPR